MHSGKRFDLGFFLPFFGQKFEFPLVDFRRYHKIIYQLSNGEGFNFPKTIFSISASRSIRFARKQNCYSWKKRGSTEKSVTRTVTNKSATLPAVAAASEAKIRVGIGRKSFVFFCHRNEASVVVSGGTRENG